MTKRTTIRLPLEVADMLDALSTEMHAGNVTATLSELIRAEHHRRHPVILADGIPQSQPSKAKITADIPESLAVEAVGLKDIPQTQDPKPDIPQTPTRYVPPTIPARTIPKRPSMFDPLKRE